MTKLFSHAGVSRTGTTLKVRWCNGADRVKALIKDGQRDIDIIELRTPMTKEDAVACLLSIDFDNGNAEVRSTLEAEATKRNLPGYEVVKEKKPRAKKSVDTVAEDVTTVEAAVEDNRIELPRQLSMTPDAIRKREARARKAAEIEVVSASA